MLQAKTKEQLYKIAEIIGMDAYEVFSENTSAFLGKFEPIHSIQIDIPISFNQMAEIVDYLREQNNKQQDNGRNNDLHSS